jgi:hypothetical protein
MDDKRFWDVIAAACKRDVKSFTSDWGRALVEQLKTLSPEQIVRFQLWFEEKVDAAYSQRHWGAAYLINGGASDDGFYYWRCWLVGMGKVVYEAALADPDSLADALAEGRRSIYEAAGICSAARRAWEQLGRGDEEDLYDACDALGKPQRRRASGDAGWDFDDREETRRRLPRLAALYWPEEDSDDEGD